MTGIERVFRLLDLCDRIAGGESIDWNTPEFSDPALLPESKALQYVERVVRGHRESGPSAPPSQPIGTWGHLHVLELRWAHGRLPSYPRGMAKTDLLAYLRQILLNEIRGEIRKAKRRPETVPITDEATIGSETFRRYEEALARLSQDHREAIVMRVEMGFQFDEVALALGIRTAIAARMTVGRALLLLSRHMPETGSTDPKSKSA
jgi:hypothetical protein